VAEIGLKKMLFKKRFFWYFSNPHVFYFFCTVKVYGVHCCIQFQRPSFHGQNQFVRMSSLCFTK